METTAGDGYTCAFCGQFILYGNYHDCQTQLQSDKINYHIDFTTSDQQIIELLKEILEILKEIKNGR